MNADTVVIEATPDRVRFWRVLEALAYRESRMNYLAVGRSSDMGLRARCVSSHCPMAGLTSRVRA